jgi:hypothetical protein
LPETSGSRDDLQENSNIASGSKGSSTGDMKTWPPTPNHQDVWRVKLGM